MKNKIIPTFIVKRYFVFFVTNNKTNINIKIREILNGIFLNIVKLCIYMVHQKDKIQLIVLKSKGIIKILKN